MTLMEKDGAQQEFPDSEVEDALAAGWRPVDGTIPLARVYEDPGTGQQRIERGRVAVDQYQQAAQEAANTGQSLIRITPEVEEIHRQQREMDRERAIAEQEGVLGQLGFSTLDRLAFGGISALVREVDPAAGARLTERSEILARQNPGVETLATLTSIGIPLAMGGAGLARAFAGPTGLAMEAGQLARSGLGGITGRMVGGAVEGGLDLALMEAVDANIRNDYEGLSERMLASGALGALFGTAVEGGLLAREARAQARIRREVLGEVRGQQLASQPPGILRRIYDRASELLSGNNPSQFRVRRMGDIPVTDDAAVAAFRRVSGREGEVLGELAGHASDALQAHRRVANELRDARWFQGTTVRQAWNAAPDQAVALSAVGNGVAEAAQRAQANRLTGAARNLPQDALEAARKGDVQELLAIREQAKALQGKGGEVGAIGDMLQASIDNGLAQAGGDFAKLFQARQNALAAIDSFEVRLGKLFQTPQGVGKLDARQIRSVLDDYARGGNQEALDVLEALASGRVIDDAVDSLGVTRPWSPNSAATASQRAREIATDWEAYSQFRNLELNINSASGFSAALGLGGSSVLGIGLAMDDPETAAIGGAGLLTAFLSKPTGAARFMNTLKNLFRSQDSRITASAANVRSAIRGNALSPSKIAPATAAGKALLSDNRQEREQVYETMATRVEEMLANPDSFYRSFLPQVEGADAVNPQLGMQMGVDAQRALTVLAENVPLSRRARRNLPRLPGIEIPPSDSEMDEFLEAAAVIEDPIFALDLFSAGRLSNTGARALQRAYPAFYRGVASEVFQEYARMTQEGQMPDFQASVRMSTLLGMPLDPSMDPSMLLALQSNYSQTAEQERAVRSPDTVQREVGNLYASNNQTMGQGLQ